MTYYILYNPKADNGKGAESAKKVEEFYKEDSVEFIDTTKTTYDEIFEKIGDAPIVLCGGDGTINYFINNVKNKDYPNPVYYFAGGSGNDFLRDLGLEKGSAPVEITKYLKNLPTVEVDGKTYSFLNNVGFGIDGYCCEVGDKLRETTDKPINYSGIAIKGLLFHFKRVNATVKVDGVEHNYKNVWLAPTMNGRFYGGGMMPTPNQDRLNPDKTLSVMIMHSGSKIGTLIVFPSIFKGEHVKKTKMVEVLTGSEIEVVFDKPTAIQIDGETIVGMTKYVAHAGKRD